MLQLMEAQRVRPNLGTEQQQFKQKAFIKKIPGYEHKIFSPFLILYLNLSENFDPNCFVPSYEIKLGFPGDSMINSPPAYAGDAQDSGSIPVWERSPAGENDNLLQ